jgi:hypothetical protein
MIEGYLKFEKEKNAAPEEPPQVMHEEYVFWNPYPDLGAVMPYFEDM